MYPSPLKVVAVVFPDFELLDLYGPLELLGMLRKRVVLTLVAEHVGVVSSNQGPKSVVDSAIADVESLDVLLVPGGWGTRGEVNNERLLGHLRTLAGKAKFVTSVCTGSALLAKAGILDGMRATTNKRAFDWVVSQGPSVTWVKEARWVEDGKFFTSSGVSAGMDMTLALIQKIFGLTTCIEVARWAEYTWHEDSTIDPFAAQSPQKG